MNRNDPVRDDAMHRSSAHAHKEAYPDDRECSEANDVHRTTPHRWSTSGRGSPLSRFAKYFDAAPDQFRLLAHLETRSIQKTVRKLLTPDLVALFHRVVQEDADDECAERKLEVLGEDWLDLARAIEKDASSDLRKAACVREFAVRRLTREEVWSA